jgi:O-antigen ligase
VNVRAVSHASTMGWPRGWLRSRRVLVRDCLLGALLLYIGYNAILRTRSIKYPVMFILVGIAASVFLKLKRKHSLLLFASGFSIPFFIQTLLMDRDKMSLSLTGHFLAVAVLGGVVLVTRIKEGRGGILETGIFFTALIYMGTGALSFVNTTDRTLTVLALVQQAEMVLIFIILTNAVWKQDHLVMLLRGLYLGFAIECLLYVIQNILGVSFDVLGHTRMVGTTDVERGYIGSHRGTFDTAPAVAALYFSVVTLSMVGLRLCRRPLPLWVNPVLGMLLGGGCLALAAKRAPLAGFVLGLLTMSVLIAKAVPTAMRRMVPVLVGLLLPALALAPVLVLRAEANHEAAYEERTNLNRLAWEMFHAHPIAGVGFGTYDSVKRVYVPEDWSGWIYTVHNNYMMVLAETGTAGLIAFLLFLLTVLATAYRGIRSVGADFRPLQISLFAGLVAIGWEMYWDMFNGRQQAYIFWFMTSLAVIVPRVLKRAEPA